VGATEQNVRQALRIADAMSPCLLFCDELDKGLSGVGGQGDSGVSTRLFGTLLTWLAEHESDVFFIGTANNISMLPPEFTRAERLDGVFFLDVPNIAERDQIWKMYRAEFGIPETRAIVPLGSASTLARSGLVVCHACKSTWTSPALAKDANATGITSMTTPFC
jgi:SpoVK/Ycf46/Vps4 family AAA+-type ATPase